MRRRVFAGIAAAGIAASSYAVVTAAPASAATESASSKSASSCVLIDLALDLTAHGGPYIQLLCL